MPIPTLLLVKPCPPKIKFLLFKGISQSFSKGFVRVPQFPPRAPPVGAVVKITSPLVGFMLKPSPFAAVGAAFAKSVKRSRLKSLVRLFV